MTYNTAALVSFVENRNNNTRVIRGGRNVKCKILSLDENADLLLFKEPVQIKQQYPLQSSIYFKIAGFPFILQ